MKLVVAVLLLVSGVHALQVPADGDLWTEDSSYLSSWSPARVPSSVISYVTGDVQKGSYAVQITENPGYFSGLLFNIPSGPLDMSDPLTKMTCYLKISHTNAETSIPVQIRFYTDANLASYFYSGFSVTKDSWLWMDAWKVSNFGNPGDGTPDWSHVYALGIFSVYLYGDATTMTIDNLYFQNIVPEPMTLSLLFAGSVALLRRRK